MAATVEGARATEQHRLAQLEVEKRALADLRQIWPAFDIKNPESSWEPVKRSLMAVVEVRRQESARQAAFYYQNFRFNETGELFDPVIATQTASDAEAAAVSLDVTGLFSARHLNAENASAPASITLVRLSGTVGRLVLNGGRQTIEENTRRDERSTGYARVTSGKACFFCAMLASRGPVYRSDTVRFRAHDHCRCTAEPRFHDLRSAWPPKSREYRELWDATTGEASGQEAVRVFRRAYEGRAV